MELFTTLNTFVGYGTLATQLLTVALLVAYIRKQRDIETIVAAWAIPASFIVATLASIASLIYSDYFGVIPCGLCWLQRIFLYPQVVLFAIALYIKDARVYVYSIALSFLGLLVAGYQHYLQMGGTGVLPCPAAGAADCSVRIIFEMGYITFPLAAASIFALLIVLMLFLKRTYERSTAATPR